MRRTRRPSRFLPYTGFCDWAWNRTKGLAFFTFLLLVAALGDRETTVELLGDLAKDENKKRAKAKAAAKADGN